MATFSGATVEKALDILRKLPRVTIGNVRDLPGGRKNRGNKRSQRNRGCGQKGSGQRQNYIRLGYETGSNPFYTRHPFENYKPVGLKRQYPPVTLGQLQKWIDLGWLDPTQPIDLTTLCNSFRVRVEPMRKHYGIHLIMEGVDYFKAKLNLEVQWASEPVIAAVERNGGTITTAYYDIMALFAAVDPEKFFKRGVPIPRRQLPPQDLIEYYSDPRFRGYLADPAKVAFERRVLAQKYGYKEPNYESDPQREMLSTKKDTRQIWYGLEPGWVILPKRKTILKTTDPELQQYYSG